MDMNSPMFIMIPGMPFIFCNPVSDFVKACRKKDICMNCRHFFQTEDWREAPEGFYLPKGECHYNPPTHNGFPKLNGGKKCSRFERRESSVNDVPPWKRERLKNDTQGGNR